VIVGIILLKKYLILWQIFFKEMLKLLFVVYLTILAGGLVAQGLEGEMPNEKKDSITIGNIFIDCHHKTKERIILRELMVKKGMRVPKNALRKLLDKENQKLFNTDLFIVAEVLPLPARQDSVDLVVSLIEKWYFYPIPILELADRNFNEWWQQRNADIRRLNYGINFRQQNVGGRNEDLRVLLQVGFTKKIGIEYHIPYINGKQTTGINFGISYSENKDIAFKIFRDKLVFSKGIFNEKEGVLLRNFSADINLTKREHFYNSHSFNLSYHYRATQDSVLFFNPTYFPNSSTQFQYMALGYQFLRDLRNAAPYPLTGLYLKLDFVQRGLGILSNFNQTQLETVFAKFTSLGKNFFWAGSARAAFVFPENQPFSQLQTFGFRRNYLRGYELYAIDATRFAILKNTLRYQVFNTQKKIKCIPLEQFNTVPVALYLKIYADMGYAYKTQVGDDDFLSLRLLSSYGVGADLVTYYNMVFRFEYSVNHLQKGGFFIGIQSDF